MGNGICAGHVQRPDEGHLDRRHFVAGLAGLGGLVVSRADVSGDVSRSAPNPGAGPFPRLMWTLDLASPSFGGGAIGDLAGDGTLVLVFGTYYNDEHLYAVRARDGVVLWEFRSEGGPFDASVALTDLDGD